jgi:hypothetical protein
MDVLPVLGLRDPILLAAWAGVARATMAKVARAVDNIVVVDLLVYDELLSRIGLPSLEIEEVVPRVVAVAVVHC